LKNINWQETVKQKRVPYLLSLALLLTAGFTMFSYMQGDKYPDQGIYKYSNYDAGLEAPDIWMNRQIVTEIEQTHKGAWVKPSDVPASVVDNELAARSDATTLLNDTADEINNARDVANPDAVLDAVNKAKAQLEKWTTFNHLSKAAKEQQIRTEIAAQSNKVAQQVVKENHNATIDSNYTSNALMNKNMAYYVTDATGRVFTNIPSLQGKKLSDTAANKAIKAESASKTELFSAEITDQNMNVSENEAINDTLISATTIEVSGTVGLKGAAANQYAKQVAAGKLGNKLSPIAIGLLVLSLISMVGWTLFGRSNGVKLTGIIEKLPIEIRALYFGLVAGGALLGTAVWVSLSANFHIATILGWLIGFDLLASGFVLTAVLVFKNLIESLQVNRNAAKFVVQVKQGLIGRFVGFIKRQVSKLPLTWAVPIALVALFVYGFIVLIVLDNFSTHPLISIVLLVLITGVFYHFFGKIVRGLLDTIMATRNILKKHQLDFDATANISGQKHNLEKLDQLVESNIAETEKNSALKAELITNVSHDLRTPLTGLITYADLLKQPDLTAEQHAEYLEVVNQKAARMKSMLDDLFEVTKMDHGEVELLKAPLELNDFLHQVVSENEDLFTEKALALVEKYAEPPIQIELDGAQMWRVFENLLKNIEKYSLPNSRVFIRTEQVDQVARITFKNVSAYALNEDADQLVARFSRGDASRHSEGSGLGLAIVDSIVKLHGGTLAIEVDGDVFKLTIDLPL
jgi:signal transduction histidine kinase